MAKVRIIAIRTSAVDRLLYAPFTVLVFLLLARNPAFTNMRWNLPLVVTFVSTGIGSVIGAFWLRLAAGKARSRCLERLRDNLLVAHEKHPDLVPHIEEILQRVEVEREGAFCAIQEHPLVRAILLPLTGAGATELIGLWTSFT
jgi:hypothetical protein